MTTRQPSGMTVPQAMREAARLDAAGESAAAEALYRQLLAAAPDCHPAYHALALLACRFGRLPLAADLTARAIALDGTVGIYHRDFGEMCRRLGRLDDAAAAGRRAAQLLPDNVDAHYNLALALADGKHYAEAAAGYRRALALGPEHGPAWNNLGSALDLMGDKAAAEDAYAKAVALNPRHAEAQNNLGALYSGQGRLEDACECFNAAIAARHGFAEAHFNLSTLKTYSVSDPHYIMLETLADVAESLPLEARIRFHFALGKAHEDVGDHDRAFAAYARGNRLQAGLHPYDEAWADALCVSIKATFDRRFFEQRPRIEAGDSKGRTPVFILGMPRSGTSLIEQIFASHPDLFGAGELKDLSDVIHQVPQAVAGQPFTAWCANLSAQEFAALGEAYRERVWRLAPDKAFITDKMPGNFFLIGMIHQMLPNAKIIHAMRDPMDSCFSCYSRLFSDRMDFAYDLRTLGRYYLRYMDLMRHWHAVLPAGTILDLHYEQMVADMEGQSRRMLEFVGLPWNESCLDFHKNKRHVKTASVAQVRKPIYQTSVARWKRFGAHLAPLLELVRD
ncbi:tetratricopeptide repeat protein [Noviherbaspirillum cavernae]|uniref:Tetratricopeptide repeat protein n=1 Tax=Noviherbaspirillum cavernae TaxID=2320862 RepID=A0A418X4J3_9BURK|nr:sulfotransferase [Noviherbaspirillum cavernae]RJG07398.1 tetratricopeptide repeat protein [Noviherbaspirillum cavernae]